jgi:hypothetical protein
MITSKSLSSGGLGRMGNQMFTIAGCIGIALRSGQSYAFPAWITKDNEIFGQKPDNINDYLVKSLPPLADWSNFLDYGYFWGYKDVYLPIGNWSIDAHMQSEKFFKSYIRTIRETFTFKDEPEQNDYVAIHYRAGDYIDNPDAQHPRCSKEYYEKAIALFPEENFFDVYTDDKEAFTGLGIKANFRFNGRSNYIDDFKYLKRSKSFICANSSFSLMAAILGDHPEKKIVCPRRWFGSQMPPEFNTDDIYPENAIIL